MSKRNLIAIGLIVALVTTSLFFGYHWGRSSVEVRTVTKTEYKPIFVEKPVPTQILITGNTIPVPVKPIKAPNDTITHLEPITSPTSPVDTSTATMVVDLPEELVEYRDSTKVRDDVYLHYRIGVKGYNPSLAYADFAVPYTHTSEVIQKKKPAINFNFGIIAGAGYGIINRQPDIFVGAGVCVSF